MKFADDILLNNDLVDIWRIRNPDSEKFTWRQKSPIIQRRLVYWLICDLLQDDVANVDIVTAIKTDHSAIILEIDSVNDQRRGPPFGNLTTAFWMSRCILSVYVIISQSGLMKLRATIPKNLISNFYLKIRFR